MASMKCFQCARWSFQNGCALERDNYYQFRDCMLDHKDYSFPKEQPVHPEFPQEGAAHDRH